MTNEEQKRIFSKNLSKYVAESGKQQKEIAGTGKLGTLAKYFRVGLSDLVNEKEEKELDAEYSDVAMKIGLTDKRFMNIILEYDKLPPDKKDLLCDFFEKFVF